jgi:site-specific DNA recombinase
MKPYPARSKIFRCAVYVNQRVKPDTVAPADALAQRREAIERLIASRERQGWICLPQRYEDIGREGPKRPGLRRLLADVQAGKIDCVAVHGSSDLIDYQTNRDRIYGILRRHGVTLISVWPAFILIWGAKLEDGWLPDPPLPWPGTSRSET